MKTGKHFARLLAPPLAKLALICAAALLLRLAFLLAVHNPGLHDPIHYYNLGARLLAGEGFTIDYVWHYSRLPEAIVHPIDHWMPLSGVLAAAGMAVFGKTAVGAVLPFTVLSALVPALVYAAAGQLRLAEVDRLLAAAFAVALPDLVLNGLRPDTTTPNMLLVGGSLVLLVRGWQRGGLWPYLLSGALAGLAYLNRNDAALLLPMLAVTLLIYRLWGQPRRFHWRALLMPLCALLVVAPWLARNQAVLGMPGTAETGRMFFMVDQRDHYAYDTEISLTTMLAQRTPAELIAKRAFELAAAFKQMVVSLDVVLPVLVAGGLLLLMLRRDRPRLLALAPPLVLLLGVLVAYPLLIPYKSQSGSFEKAYLTLVPLLLPVGAYALAQAVPDTRLRIAAAGLSVAVMAFNSFDLVRLDILAANAYHTTIAGVAEAARTLPDRTGDGEVRLMSQDPYALSYYGVRSVMTPLASREQTLELAQRYQIDYLVLPAGRPALDPLYRGAERDPRFERVMERHDLGSKTVEFYALDTEP